MAGGDMLVNKIDRVGSSNNPGTVTETTISMLVQEALSVMSNIRETLGILIPENAQDSAQLSERLKTDIKTLISGLRDIGSNIKEF